MNDKPYHIAKSFVEKTVEYLRHKQYQDGVLDRSKITIYLGEKEREAFLDMVSYIKTDITENTLLGCRVIFVKELSHFKIT